VRLVCRRPLEAQLSPVYGRLGERAPIRYRKRVVPALRFQPAKAMTGPGPEAGHPVPLETGLSGNAIISASSPIFANGIITVLLRVIWLKSEDLTFSVIVLALMRLASQYPQTLSISGRSPSRAGLVAWISSAKVSSRRRVYEPGSASPSAHRRRGRSHRSSAPAPLTWVQKAATFAQVETQDAIDN
jgi:hypothetical protein